MKVVMYTDDGGLGCINRNDSLYVWSKPSTRRQNIVVVDTDIINNYREYNEEYYIPVGKSNENILFVGKENVVDERKKKKENFFKEKLQQSAHSLKGIAGLVTQSFEIEAMTGTGEHDLSRNLRAIGKGLAKDKQINDGNGWNDDVHHDGTLSSYVGEHGGLYGTETSASPISVQSYSVLKDELERVLGIYKQASNGKVHHTINGSTHVHNTLSYYYDANSVELDYKELYDNLGRFFLKFMPVMKWLVMTDKYGARGCRGTRYDRLSRDELFDWWGSYESDTTSNRSFEHITSMGRDSYLRIYSRDRLHFENRMCDCTLSPTHLAMWLSVNKAITLLAIDFTRNNFKLPLSDDEVEHTYKLMCKFESGYVNIDKNAINSLYKQFVSYLAKYLKVANALEAISVMDKLIKQPIPEWLINNEIEKDYWDLSLIEKVFNTRNRSSDEELREKFLYAIKSMQVPFAESLTEFHENIATHLGVETKKVRSLYQMFKRENIDIEFLGGRLVYLGD